MICPICIGTTIATYGVPVASGIVSGYVAARIVNIKNKTLENGKVGVVKSNKNYMTVTYK